MHKSLLILALIAGAAVSRPSMAPAAPSLLLHFGGGAGVFTAPATLSGQGLGYGMAGFEYIAPALPELGWNVGYTYEDVGPAAADRDNYYNMSARAFGPHWGRLNGWLQAGIGFNSTPNPVNDHFRAFVEPGLRWVLLPRLALDGGVQYLVQTPSSAFRQSFSVNLALSIPLAGAFSDRVPVKVGAGI